MICFVFKVFNKNKFKSKESYTYLEIKNVCNGFIFSSKKNYKNTTCLKVLEAFSNALNISCSF